MADDLTSKDASGNALTVGADEVSSVKYPRVKVCWGANDAINDASAAAPLPVSGALAASSANIGDVDVLTIAAGETHIGQVGVGGDVIDVTPVLAAATYTTLDVLCDTATITNAVRVSGGRAMLESITIIDEDDQGAAIDFYFFRATQSLGAKESAPDISDAAARDIIGFISVSTGDYKDIGGVKICCLRGLRLLMEPTTGRDLFLGAVVTGTPTYTASGLKLRFGFTWY